MRTAITIGICIALTLALSAIVSAQSVGCCCDPVTKNGSFMPQSSCPATYIFGVPTNSSQTCSQFCGAQGYQPSQPVCGNNICETGETATNCAQDCAVISGCGSPNYAPAPTLSVSPVRAQKSLLLTYTTACTPDYVTIYRCKGTSCTPTQTITQGQPTGQFIDNDANLEFNVDYTYAISAYYQLAGNSANTTATGNAGDIECYQQSSNAFCISSSYYEKYRTYLTTFGYGGISGSGFNTQFTGTVNSVFAGKLNKAYQCNAQNKLTSAGVACTTGEYCVADEQGPKCVSPTACDTGDPFGLYSSSSTCETNSYCFFDKSLGPTNKCYACKQQMACADYKTQGACQRDNCNAGDCQWNSVFADLGIGVCIDQQASNCIFCAKNGTTGVETTQVTSTIWDACTEQKSEALSTQDNPCFFDRNLKQAKTCEQVSCADYTQMQCGSPSGGVQLGTDNSVVVTSSDQCGIGVCQWSDTAGCVKNADGTTGDPFKDCPAGDYTCERDYFPPETTIIPTGIAGKIDKLIIKIFDQQTTSGATQDYAGQPNFTTYLCVQNTTTNCNNAKTYPIQVSANELIISNRQLKQGQTTLTTLPEGTNTLYYYSRDNHNNIEVVKTVTFFACAACNGPQILNLTITDGAALNNTIYTSSFSPVITVTFDVPTEITFLQLQGPGNPSFTQQTSGMQLSHTFAAPTLTLGTYTFGFNGKNDKNIFFTPPGPTYTLIVDNVAPTVTIQPANAILNTSQIDVNLTFSKPVQLDVADVISMRYLDFSILETPRSIKPVLTSTDKINYKARVGNISGGTNAIHVYARGYNNLPIEARTQFYMATRAPDMRMTVPPFGSANTSQFIAEIETELPAECAYIYNTPTAPNASDFDLFQKFTDAGNKHTSQQLTIPSGVESAQLHAYCRTNWGINQKTFTITLDTEPPVIKRVIAEPPIIAEKYLPDKDLYVTTMKVELDKPGFCKYSTTTSQFSQMTGQFPGYDLVPKTTHSAQINVTEERTYRYYISCKATNQLVSEPAEFDVVVDLSLDLNITSVTPRGFSTTNVTIGVASNKRTFCYFGTQEDDQSTCMGSCSADYVQWQPIQVAGEGEHTYFVSCVQPSTQEKVGPITIPVLVDTTPPTMEYVLDDGPFEDPELSWSKTKLRAAFKGNDLESSIDHYLVTIQDRNNRQLIVSNLVSNVTDGNYTYIRTRNDGGPLNLVNGRTYIFKVKAVNKVGLISEEMESDGVTIDVTLEPAACVNGDVDGNETDEDCGGSECSSCAIGKACVVDGDCETNSCVNNVCTLAVCDDEVKNGFETDVDCGGTTCSACTQGQECILHSDCETGYCGYDSKVCEDASHCSNGQLDVGEAGVDCGRACPTLCPAKSACEVNEDCADGLKCDIQFNICTDKPVGDEDYDGIYDPFDACLGTPVGEQVDEKGCGLSQTFSLGDTIDDKWRLDHFGCIDCAEAAEGTDFDKDGLTNKQEYDLRTNPALRDTDKDRWNDGKEVEEGTDPLNPKSHPPSIILGALKVLMILFAIAGVGIGAYLLYQHLPKPKEETKAQRKEQPEYTKTEELDKLRTFAKKEDLEEKDWIDLEKQIKKKPIPPKKFEAALERLRKLAKKETSKDPIERLHAILEETGRQERKELLEKLKLLHEGALTKKEIEELFRKLKITAEYYEEHKKEFEQELKRYGHGKK